TAEPIIFDVNSRGRTEVKTPPLELSFQEGPGFEWFPDGKAFFYDYNTRGVKVIELRTVDAESGDQKVVLREEAERYVDPGESASLFWRASSEFLGCWERDGWNHLSL